MAIKATMPQVIKRVETMARKSKPESLRQTMGHAGDAIVRDIKRAFAEEKAPQIIHPDVRSLAGQNWAPLAPATVAQRGRKARWAKGRKRTRHTRSLAGSVQALQDTGTMRRAIQRSVEKRGGDRIGAWAGISASVWYSEVHQFGKGNTPARPFVGFMQRTVREAMARILRYVTRK